MNIIYIKYISLGVIFDLFLSEHKDREIRNGAIRECNEEGLGSKIG